MVQLSWIPTHCHACNFLKPKRIANGVEGQLAHRYMFRGGGGGGGGGGESHRGKKSVQLRNFLDHNK